MNGRQRKFATTTICLVAYCFGGYEVRCTLWVLYFESSCDQALRYIARVWVCTGTKILIDTRLFRPKWNLPLWDLNGPIVSFVVCIGMCYTVVICWRRELRPEQKVDPGGRCGLYTKNVPGMYRSGMSAGLETMAKTCWYTVTLLKSSEILIVLLWSVDTVKSLSTSVNHNICRTGPKFSKLCEMWLFGIVLLDIYQIAYLSF